jgi:acyl-CoA synthetase (AMP-forming)/AMP-acid ligase II
VEEDVVIIISENRLEFLTISLATIILGAIVAPLNIAYNEGK